MGIRLEGKQMLRELIGSTERLPQQIFNDRLDPIIQDSITVGIDLILAASRKAVKITKRARGL